MAQRPPKPTPLSAGSQTGQVPAPSAKKAVPLACPSGPPASALPTLALTLSFAALGRLSATAGFPAVAAKPPIQAH